MPKVIHIVLGKANPDRLNGVNKVVHSVASQSVQTGRSVEVWGFTAQPDPVPTYDFPVRLFAHRPYQFQLTDDVTTAIRAEPSDTIFHLHGGLIPLYYTLARYLARKGWRYILTPHGSLLKRSLLRGIWYKAFYVMVFERYILKNALWVHCITVQERRDILSLLSKAKVKMIPNGTTVLTTPITIDRTQTIRFLYMGRFAIDHKGLDILIKAFAIFLEAHRSAYLFLAGEGPDHKKIQKLIQQYRLKHHIRVLPPQFHAEKTALLKEADVFVHLSRWDVLPTSCLEAAAHGKPLLVSKATGLAPYIDTYQAGWLVKTASPSEAAQKLSDAFYHWKHGKLDAIGQHARDIITQDLNWPSLTERFYKDLYNHVAT